MAGMATVDPNSVLELDSDEVSTPTVAIVLDSNVVSRVFSEVEVVWMVACDMSVCCAVVVGIVVVVGAVGRGHARGKQLVIGAQYGDAVEQSCNVMSI